MQQKAFKAILERYLNDACSPGEKKLVEEWFEAIGKETRNELTGDEERRLFDAYQDDMDRIFRGERSSSSARLSYWMKVAATVLIILGAVLYWYVPESASSGSVDDVFATGDGTGSGTIINDRPSARLVVLNDGSRVILNPGSVLTCKLPFNEGSREVALEGEAFFEVTPDSLSPFVVKTGELVTSVLGTSFTIKANKGGEDIVVTVKTGKVLVKQLKGGKGKHSEMALLRANQQAVCNIQLGSISQNALTVEQQPVKRDGVLPRYRFHEAPIVDILRELESQHSFKIIFDEKNFAGCLLSTSLFLGEDFFERLDIICKAIGASYKVDDASVLITGKSCGTTDSIKRISV